MSKKTPPKAGSTKSKPVAKAAAKSPSKPSAQKPKPMPTVKAKKPESKAPAKPAQKPQTKAAPAKSVKPAPVVAKPTAKVPAKAAEKSKVVEKAPGKVATPTKPASKAASPAHAAKPVQLHPLMPQGLGRLLDGKGVRKPLIPSGPKASHARPLGQHGAEADAPPEVAPVKTTLSAHQLEHFRVLLLAKRAELLGDVTTMESQALRSGSGSLSTMPSHIAEQGSEAYDQSLSLDLAAADRKLIREIDAALKRISEGTFGMCELTGKPIKIERLHELPWARYSIEAAREIERQSMRG